MLRPLLLAALMLSGAPAQGFEIEAERLFQGSAPVAEVRLLSTTDSDIAAPLIEAFLQTRPDLSVRYVMASSREVYAAIADEGAPFDLVISSAMDLQMKLANDGFARPHSSDAALALPDWARWRDLLFGFALEPVVTVVSLSGFQGLPIPQTRHDLIALLRENPDRFTGRIGTYDPHESGAGYLFATEDARQTDAFWRLAEVMGRLNARLFCCSGEMIDELRAGRLAIAYNVVASYAARYTPDDPDLVRLALEDYTLAIIRSALVPANAGNPEGATDLLSYLLSPPAQQHFAESSGTALMPGAGQPPQPHLRPIRLDAGLLVYDDQLRRAGLLSEWNAAMVQP